jgi:transcriptional regulator GlxA family with amidase domain
MILVQPRRTIGVAACPAHRAVAEGAAAVLTPPTILPIIDSRCAQAVARPLVATMLITDLMPVPGVVVAGCMGPRELHYEPGFLNWQRLQGTRARRFGSICTGAFVLAKAGLLDGRRATTHWNWASELALGYPRVAVDPSPIFIRDGSCYTSAGVTAGIDLCLALVEEDLGRPLALRIAQMMVVFLRCPGGQSQFSATLEAQTRESRPLGDLLGFRILFAMTSRSTRSLGEQP